MARNLKTAALSKSVSPSIYMNGTAPVGLMASNSGVLFSPLRISSWWSMCGTPPATRRALTALLGWDYGDQ